VPNGVKNVPQNVTKVPHVSCKSANASGFASPPSFLSASPPSVCLFPHPSTSLFVSPLLSVSPSPSPSVSPSLP